MTPIKITIAEKYPLFRLALCQTLQSDTRFIITSVLENQQDIVIKLQDDKPDVLLLDSLMVEGNLNDYCYELKKNFPSLNIIILSTDTEGLSAKKNFKDNIDGFMLKTLEAEELIKAIMSVYKGERYIQLSLRLKLTEWLWTSSTKKKNSSHK